MPIDLSLTPAVLAARVKAERERLKAAARAEDKYSRAYTIRWVADRLGLADHQTYAAIERPAGVDFGVIRLVELAAIGYDLRRIIPEAFALRGRVRTVKTTEADGAE